MPAAGPISGRTGATPASPWPPALCTPHRCGHRVRPLYPVIAAPHASPQASACTPPGSTGLPHPSPRTPLLRAVRRLAHKHPPFGQSPHHAAAPVQPATLRGRAGRDMPDNLPRAQAPAEICDTCQNLSHLPRMEALFTDPGGGMGQVEPLLRSPPPKNPWLPSSALWQSNTLPQPTRITHRG